MVSSKCEYLKFTRFSAIKNWSVYNNTSEIFQSSYPILPLSEVLVRAKEVEKIEDEKKYKRITIKLYGMGVTLRDEVFGSEIGTKRQFIARAGQLIISRIDARNGAFGIVPPELNGAIVTNDFWLFDVKNASVDFLLRLLSSKSFEPYWQSKSSGTTNRQRVNEKDFLNTRVPLPDKNIQNQLVENYQKLCVAADEKINNRIIIEDEIEQYLFEVLGIIEPKKPDDKKKLIKTYRLNDLTRWDIWNKKDNYKSLKYEFVDLENVVLGKPLYGANEKAIKTKTDTRYIRITDINEDGSLNDDFVSALKVEEKYLLKENDLLIARSGNTVGKTFLYKKNMGRAIFAGYLIKFTLNEEKVIPEYLFQFTKSKLFKSWVESNKRIFGQPNINGQEYLKAQIIVPPKEIQGEIVEFILLQREKINTYNKKSRELRNLANKDFEEAIWG